MRISRFGVRAALASIVLPAAVVAVSGQRTAALPEPVRLDVVVTDSRGRIVTDLRRGDFEIFEGDVQRPVEDARFVPAVPPAPASGTTARQSLQEIATRRDEQEAAAEDGARLFGIFLDEYHVTSGGGAGRARDELAAFVRSLGPRDLVAVFRPLDSVLTIRMMRDHEAAARAVEEFDPRRGVLEPRNAFEQYFIAGGSDRIESVRVQISTSGISALAAHLAGLGAGPKALILLSEGFDRGSARRRGDDLPTINSVLRVAARTGVAIYAIDPRVWDEVPPPPLVADAAADPGAPEDHRRLLVALATDTGGAAILQPADLSTVWPRLTADLPGHYVVTFRGADDGNFHPVAVRVRRQGLAAATRHGYWATSPAERAAAGLLAEDRAPRPPPEPARRASPLIRPWFGLTRGDDGRTRVRFVWEPAPRVPGQRTRAQPPARVTMKATQADGTAVFEGVVGAATPSAPATGDPLQAVFDAAPGRLLIQMTIENAVAQVLDVDVRDVSVSALNTQVGLGTPQVWRARNAREFRVIDEHPEAAPSATREFSRTERLLVRVPAFGTEAPQVSARLLSRQGTPIREIPLTTEGDGTTRRLDLPLAGFAVGDYAIEFLARGQGRDVREALRFRVGP